MPALLAGNTAHHKRSRFRESGTQAIIPRLYRRATLITANSSESVAYLQRVVGGGPRYALWPNMLDIQEIRDRAKAGQPEDLANLSGFRIVAVGRLHWQKGYDTLIRALARLRTKQPWHCVIVGEGPERRSLEELVAELGVSEKVRFQGSVSDPAPHYRWADIVVVPSRFEGFPNVPLEAMACGAAVICADCLSGPRELTLNGYVGLLVRVEDPEGLACAIDELLENDARRRHLGTLAASSVEERFATGRIAPGILASLKDLL